MNASCPRRCGAAAAGLVLLVAACRPALTAPAALLPADDAAPADGAPRDLARDELPAPEASDAAACVPLVVKPAADAYVAEDTPAQNLGRADAIDIDTGAHGYLRFAITGVQGAVTAAILRVFVDNDTDDGPTIHTTDSAWDETAITWNNRPAPDEPPLRDLDAVAKGWNAIDLGAAVAGDGEISFAFVPTSTDGMTFASRETANGAQLQLFIDCAPPGDAAR